MAVDFGTGYIDVEPRIDKSAAQSSMQRDLGSTLQSAGSRMRAAGAGLTAGLTLPIVGFGIAATRAFTESAKVASQTKAAIDSTGGAANVTAKEIGGLATRVSQYSGIDDEAIQSGENLLLTFTNIQNKAGQGNAIFSRATKVLADMSTRMGTDASSSAIQLGKALNDPVAGVGSLSRVGVQFTEDQKKQIAQLVKHNKTLDAQKIILGELTTEFGGSARAFGESAAGEVAKGQVAMGNAMEDMGKTILAVAGPIMTKLASILQTVMDWFNRLSPGVKQAIVIFLALVAAVGPILIILGSIVGAVGALIPVFAAVVTFITGTLIPAITGLFATLLTNPFVLIAAAVVLLAIVIIKNWDTIKRFLLAVWNALKAAGLAVWNAIKAGALAIWRVLKAVVVGYFRFWATIFRTAFNVAKAVWNGIKTAALDVWHFITGLWRGLIGFFREIWNGAKDIVVGVWHGVRDTVAGLFRGIVDVVKAPINFVIDRVNDLIHGINLIKPGADIQPIPHLAEGGIVRRPTVALIGESGAEAVVPLSRMDHLDTGGRGGRVVRGSLTLTPDSRAYVNMVIDDDASETARHVSVVNRMRR